MAAVLQVNSTKTALQQLIYKMFNCVFGGIYRIGADTSRYLFDSNVDHYLYSIFRVLKVRDIKWSIVSPCGSRRLATPNLG
jgi:hypothetical protein